MSSHCQPGSAGKPIEVDLQVPGQKPQPTILLVGNPNVGKSTLFNTLTGSRQAVMNAPGTTVEVMVGAWRELNARLLDLPGTYSLVAQSPDEQAVVDTLAGAPGSFTDAAQGKSVDLVVCVMDANALSRSLYLLAQVARTGRPVVGVLTLTDVLEEDGGVLDVAALSKSVGIPLLAVDPRDLSKRGALTDFVAAGLARRPRVSGMLPDPTAPGYNQVAASMAVAQAHCTSTTDQRGNGLCYCSDGSPCAHDQVDSTEAIANASDADRASEIFAWIDRVEKQLGVQAADAKRLSRSDKIDRLLLHPAFGVVFFFAIMWLLFKVAGEWIGPVQDFMESLFGSTEPGAISLANGITHVLSWFGLENSWLNGLLAGGLATGLGVVASFFPLMFVIFLMISVLEDSGYMARAAFLGDRLMRKIGLDGRVILPLIMGFGCNLPALAAARTIPNDRQRLVTILVTPYTSCAARLTIYLMIARIFFPQHTGTVVFAMYVLSIAMVVLGALALKPIFLRKQVQAPLMLVLPAYGRPRALVTLRQTWLRAWAFVRGAGKIIVIMTAAVWLLAAIPVSGGYSFADPDLPMENSAYGRTAQMLEPVFQPAGFGEWHMTGALLTGFVAKETVISSIVVSYNLDEAAAGDAEDGGQDLGELPDLVRASFVKSAGDAAAPIGAFAFLIFVLTYTPCMATVAEQARQIGAKITLAAVGIQLLVAWLLAVGVFQIGRLFV